MKLNPTRSQWLALILFIVTLLSLIFIIIVPLIFTTMDNYQRQQELIFRLKRSQKIIAQKPLVIKQIQQIKSQYHKQNYFSSRQTIALASADLQEFIKHTISQAGGQLTSTQVLPSRVEDGFNRITIKVRMSSNMESLRQILDNIESSTPVKLIDQIDIRPVRGKRNRNTRKIEQSNQLSINFQVVGFMRINPL